MVFANIEYLFLLLLLIPYIVWYIMRRKNSEATLQISDARVYAHAPKSYKNYLLHAPFVLRIIALALIIIVLARPQTTDSWQNSEIEGIDIMLAIDVSRRFGFKSSANILVETSMASIISMAVRMTMSASRYSLEKVLRNVR